MDIPARLDEALKRLSAALERMEAANERRARSEALRANLEEQLAVMQDDRSRLAAELDGAAARTAALEAAADDALRRLKGANLAIHDVLARVEDDERDGPAA